MLTIIGWLIVTGTVFGGFVYEGGEPIKLIIPGELIIILGAVSGILVGASPMHVIQAMAQKILFVLKGSPYTKAVFMDLVKAHYELLMVAREQGVVGIEEHVMSPKQSTIFQKYPSFLNNHEAVAFMQDALKPIIDGRLKAEQMKESLAHELDRLYARNAHIPSIMSKVADACPGIGIVAAVLGIVITMGSLNAGKAAIGEHVASALVGTFLGLLISYCYLQPLVSQIEMLNEEELAYFEVMSNIIVSYATGAPPIMAAEVGRHAIPHNHQPSSDDMEKLLKELLRKTG